MNVRAKGDAVEVQGVRLTLDAARRLAADLAAAIAQASATDHAQRDAFASARDPRPRRLHRSLR